MHRYVIAKLYPHSEVEKMKKYLNHIFNQEYRLEL